MNNNFTSNLTKNLLKMILKILLCQDPFFQMHQKTELSDPHFILQSGEERICFDQYGLDGDEMVLLYDPPSGLKITGKSWQLPAKFAIKLYHSYGRIG